MAKFDLSDSRLKHWLNQRGLHENPFAVWNAEQEANLPDYFVDVNQFDELLRATEPCVVFARRGCGKTAQRRMLADQCRPLSRDSMRLAISYTVNDFERVLSEVNGDVNQVRSIHHVNALLHSGLTTFMKEVASDVAKQTEVLTRPEARSRLAAYLARFAPHLRFASLTETPADLDFSNWLTLLQGFSEFIHCTNLETCAVLVDGLDELPFISSSPTQTITFLTSLLGMLPLIECSGWDFKFFLPEELEPTLRTQHWFRPDRLRLFPITWDDKGLLDLIGQRLAYFSQKLPPYKDLAQLCEDELAPVINQELVTLAEHLPRAALLLASMLLQHHCRQYDPPELIQLTTWELVKAEWQVRRPDFLEVEAISSVQTQVKTAVTDVLSTPVNLDLRVEENGLVLLGTHDVTGMLHYKEHEVLTSLYSHRDGVCTKEILIREAWPKEEAEGVSDQAIAASIARLRDVLRKFSPNLEYVETVKGRGYRLHLSGIRIANIEIRRSDADASGGPR